MATVNIYEAKTRLSQLLSAVEAGEDVVIARRGKPRWRVILMEEEIPVRTPGAWAGQMSVTSGWKSWTTDDEVDWYGDDPTPAA